MANVQDIIAIQAAYVRLGFTDIAAFMTTAQQQIDSLEELRELKDKEAENLCRVLRKPGGLMPNPLAGQVDQPDQIYNLGTSVSTRAENLLKHA